MKARVLAQEEFGVATEPQRRIDHVCARSTVTDGGDGRAEKLVGAVQKYRDVREAIGIRGFVHLVIHHDCSGSYFHDFR